VENVLAKNAVSYPTKCIDSSENCQTDFSQKENFGKRLFKKLEETVMVRA